MSDKIPCLTGGILFGLIIEAKKPKSKARSSFWKKQTDKLSDTDIMKSLIDIFTGEVQQAPYEETFRKNVTSYKKCIISKSEYLPFDDRNFIVSFNDSVGQNKTDTLERMSAFINDKLSEQKLKWFVSAVIETICDDETINDLENFRISPNESKFKQELLEVKVIEIESFLLDVMRYIFNNKSDNTLGKPTFEAWYSQSGERTPWKLTNAELGQNMNNLEITRYNPSVEDVEKHEYIEESDVEIEEEFNSNVESDDSITKQVLNNPKVINQYADNIYNIEHVENLN
ncbi:hypothetical protein [Streptococcus pyogenes]|uniref:hypothetical protein n=2 Tax=Streptococcus pyogenes TaxID=1314 RepID=UPI00109C4150|nr:hypothetical protein [Streptococcus pyogenes]VHC39345.1 Uncharacterised protein [Streptococcus pyogenes]VHC77195.1 Uncharacterised protein [Streptococcus pyogenes]VHD87482.1 Uncharacterised protein [Streptococcus pyogenes]VHG62352.1 Uncharacterised protein [Streptococcus pyogenes]HEP1464508.1 hypothetical protein [Streptococcus pyogenes]